MILNRNPTWEILTSWGNWCSNNKLLLIIKSFEHFACMRSQYMVWTKKSLEVGLKFTPYYIIWFVVSYHLVGAILPTFFNSKTDTTHCVWKNIELYKYYNSEMLSYIICSQTSVVHFSFICISTSCRCSAKGMEL